MTHDLAMSLPCPMCSFTHDDVDVLARHTETHFEDSPATTIGNPLRQCPMCDYTSEDIALLSAHTDQHFQAVCSTSSREEEEEEDFEKCDICGVKFHLDVLQDHVIAHSFSTHNKNTDVLDMHGMRKRIGYRTKWIRCWENDVSKERISTLQYHDRLRRLDIQLATGYEGIHQRYSDLYDKFHSYRTLTSNIKLCARLQHFRGCPGCQGFGCGFRNAQMIMSSLLNIESYNKHLNNIGITDVPHIPALQKMIEESWRDGFDAEGAAQYTNTLYNTSCWIGTTEVSTLFKYLGFKVVQVTFSKYSGPGKTHPALFKMIDSYYSNRDCPPIYLQHFGHSRTVVGIDSKNEESELLLFDPGFRQPWNVPQGGVGCTRLRKGLKWMSHIQYEALIITRLWKSDTERAENKICKALDGNDPDILLKLQDETGVSLL